MQQANDTCFYLVCCVVIADLKSVNILYTGDSALMLGYIAVVHKFVFFFFFFFFVLNVCDLA